jgi:uncharacterized protein with FMN-binding domain
VAKQSNSKVPPNLVALGTAAVLTVYGAGYWRTRAAAERFADDTRRRPAPPESPYAPPPVIAEPPVLAPALAPRPQPVTTEPATPKPVEAPAKAPDSPPKVAAPAASSQPPAPKAAMPAPAPVIPPASTTTSAAPSATSVPTPSAAPAPVTATTPVTAPTTAAPQPVAATAPEATTAPAPSAAPKWKDGSYTGWGTSRHGDIQATVVVEAGRIVSATISQCLTRYSCSWIAALPPQVVSRQSPETDYVSGATQSTNAFYYAVVEALAKAK